MNQPRKARIDTQDRAVIAISNRLPVSRGGGSWRWSAGGLVTALRPIMEARDGTWVGWDGGAEEMPSRVDRVNVDLAPVSLTRGQVQSYYHGFSNRTIWPLFHDLVQTPVFDRAWWRSYCEVNERFAQRVLEVDDSGESVLWVHDYHLMLLPALLRQGSPTAPISFFLHTPFPPPELFSRLPWRKELLHGLLGADVVSFHTQRYRKNFERVCGRVLEDVRVDPDEGVITMADGRRVLTHADPISIDIDEFATGASSKETEREFGRLARQFSGRKVLVGVDRLDYTKGIIERLEAFELVLEDNPELRDRVTLVQIAVPSRGAVNEYKDLRGKIEQTIGRINGRFTEPGGEVPIYYLHRGVARSKLLAYYRIADVFLVTALKDGMNLVSKEFVITQEAAGSGGALLLSEFAGAIWELDGALPCNPFDVEGLATRMEQALALDDVEKKDRLARMADRIRSHDIHDWAHTEIEVLDRMSRRIRRRS